MASITEFASVTSDDNWIPVEKFLPRTNRSVLVTAIRRGRKKPEVTTGAYHRRGPHHQSDDEWSVGSADLASFMYEVIAWKELPLPYKP